MFYEYSRPKNLCQRLHNKLGVIIMKMGHLLGLFSFEVSPDAQKVVVGSKLLLIWSIIASFVQVSYSVYFAIYFFELSKKHISHSTVISSGLTCLANVFDAVYTFIIYIIVVFRRKIILKVVNESARLQRLLSQWKTNENEKSRQILLYKIFGQIGFDCCYIIVVFLIKIIDCVRNFKWIKLIFILFDPVTDLLYFFITITYYVSFAYGLFLIRKLFDNLHSESNFRNIPFYHQNTFKFLKKVNSIMQPVILIIIFESFVTLVGQVSINF